LDKTKKLFDFVNSNKTEYSQILHPILMHFAANFNNSSYAEFASNYVMFVAANLKCLEEFDHDFVCLISDPVREASAFGGDVIYPDENPPYLKAPFIKSIDDVKALKNPDIYKSERTLDRLKAARLLYKELQGKIPLCGWVEGPLAEACDVAGVRDILLKLSMEPEFVKQLTEKCLVTGKQFAKAQIEEGCVIIGIGDAICSQISPKMYSEFVLPLHQELFSYIKSMGALVKIHICGNITHLLPHIIQASPDIIDIDWMVNTEKAFNVVGEDIILTGNLNPVADIMYKTEQEVFDSSKNLIQQSKGQKLILSGGCEIPAKTPPENIKAMKRAIMEAGL
jgi:MtaA/CmuA family methyltransferase